MSNDLAKLNRLRVNTGKPELKSWKASQSKLNEAVDKLMAAGALDVLPGANPEAQPVITDPVVAAARPEPEPEEEKAEDEPVVEKALVKSRAGLARGLDGEQFARNCRARIQDIRQTERKDKKKAKVELSDEDKKQIKEEAADRKSSSKETRQKQHIADKRAKREKEGKLKPTVEKDPNSITAADLARELDIDPKVARAKLRRHKEKIVKIIPKWDGSWSFPIKVADELRKILRSEK